MRKLSCDMGARSRVSLLLLASVMGALVIVANDATDDILNSLKNDLKLSASEMKTALTEVSDKVKNFAADFTGKNADISKLTGEIKNSVDKALTAQGELRARVDEIDQKMALKPRANEEPTQSIGQQFINSAEFKASTENGKASKFRGRISTTVKNTVTSLPASGGHLVTPDRVGIVPLPFRRLTVRDLLMPGRTNSNSIDAPRELVFTNSAAPVSEGVLKPESQITFELVNYPVRTIAAWIKASRQILDDAAGLRSYIDGRLRYGLALAEEGQLLTGDGASQNLTGLITAATAYSQPVATPGEVLTKIDVLRLAHLQAELAFLPSDGQVLHPSDWQTIERTKDTTGNYIFANPVEATAPRLWGRPVVSTPAMTVDKFLVGAFGSGAQIFDREDASVEVSTENDTDFVKNLVTILCEERLTLVVYRGAAFTYGDFSDANAT